MATLNEQSAMLRTITKQLNLIVQNKGVGMIGNYGMSHQTRQSLPALVATGSPLNNDLSIDSSLIVNSSTNSCCPLIKDPPVDTSPVEF